MPVFSLCSQRLSGEALKPRLPRNLKLQNEPSPISEYSTNHKLPKSENPPVSTPCPPPKHARAFPRSTITMGSE